jgi:hypothetical protein
MPKMMSKAEFKAAPRTLSEIQDAFQRAIMHGDDAFLADLVDSHREKREVLLSVYRDAYVLRLVEILQIDYGKLLACLGDEQFDAMARAFIAANPSRNPNARWVGARLPEFLQTAPPYAGRPELAELAAFERALNDVFDEEDAPALQVEALAAVPPGDWPSLTFRPRPSFRRLDFVTNALDIWRALDENSPAPEGSTLIEPLRIIVYRPEWAAMFRSMSEEEAIMWAEAVKGLRFSALCEIIATYGGEDGAAIRAAGYLKGWLDAGLLADAKCTAS